MTQEGFKRKLTSIFSADAVGYSRLMGDNEAATVRTLTSYRDVIFTLIKQHNGTGSMVMVSTSQQDWKDLQSQEVFASPRQLSSTLKVNFHMDTNF